jgi:hypothetical protein
MSVSSGDSVVATITLTAPQGAGALWFTEGNLDQTANARRQAESMYAKVNLILAS